jgi:hypothetical protein
MRGSDVRSGELFSFETSRTPSAKQSALEIELRPIVRRWRTALADQT